MTIASTIKPTPVEGISTRAIKLLKGPLSYIDVFVKAMPDLWSPTNRQGWVPLVVAENKLGNKLVLERLEQVQEYPTWVMNYGGMKGARQLQTALASLMNDTFVPQPILIPDNVCILAGCSAILDAMFYCLGEDGQSVLIPQPYYPAFDNDLQARAHLVPTPFLLDEGGDVSSQLDEAARNQGDKGSAVTAVLVSNPNNPLGNVYSKSTVQSALKWCLSNKVHYISDEIYALSIFKALPGGQPFVSALTIAQELVEQGHVGQQAVDTYVHLVYGLSKDWCASGLRVGLLYSRNTPLQTALGSLAPFAGISNHTQHALADVLSDKAWTGEFLKQNVKLLEISYDALTGCLRKAGIPFQSAVAGMFVWVDLRQWLPEQSWEGEDKLWQRICDEAKVILTPGKACHAQDPGCFRLCFAWVEVEALEDAVSRLSKVLNSTE